MQKIILVQNEDGQYAIKELINTSFDNFAAMLVKDVQMYPNNSFKLFITDPTEDFMVNRHTFMEKEEDGKVLLSSMDGPRPNYPDPDDDAFETTVKNMDEVIHRFQALSKFGPDEMVLILENGFVTLRGQDDL